MASQSKDLLVTQEYDLIDCQISQRRLKYVRSARAKRVFQLAKVRKRLINRIFSSGLLRFLVNPTKCSKKRVMIELQYNLSDLHSYGQPE